MINTTETMPPRLPRGVFAASPGRYYARISRDGKTRRDGPYDTVADAVAARIALEGASPPPRPSRTPRFKNWDAEYKRQRNALPPFTDMTGVYKRAQGVAVNFTRNNEGVYVGFFTDLTKALAARDAARSHSKLPDLTR